MAKYDKTKKYWIQLKDDWFDDDAIKWIEEQKNGIEYSHFYMKLMLKSIKTNGYLIRQVGKILIPYNPEAISNLTRTDIDTVIVAMELLKKIGLVQILEDGTIYIEQVQKMIGYTTGGAERKALQRDKTPETPIGWTKGGQMSTKDKDKDKDIIKDKYISEQVAKPTEKNSDALSEILETEDFEQELKDKIILWLQYKKEKKSGYKPTGFKVFLKDVKKSVEEHGKDYTLQRFDYSMSKNYQGVFFETSDKQVKVESEYNKKRRMKNDTSGFYG